MLASISIYFFAFAGRNFRQSKLFDQLTICRILFDKFQWYLIWVMYSPTGVVGPGNNIIILKPVKNKQI